MALNSPAEGAFCPFQAEPTHPEVVDASPVALIGNPDEAKICTSQRRAPESFNPHEDAAYDAANECVPQEVGEPVVPAVQAGLAVENLSIPL